MSTTARHLSTALAKQLRAKGPKCKMLTVEVSALGDYVAVFAKMTGGGSPYWFRGHADIRYHLAPSALRFKDQSKRQCALNILADFKRLTELKLHKPPASHEELRWIQLAQHYGLPTRLLDWTLNPAVALYFACHDPSVDGAVISLNPLDLSCPSGPKTRRHILDPNKDGKSIQPYLALGPHERSRGLRTIALHPTWNSERITQQQGAFTFHGSRSFELTSRQAPSLTFLPLLRQHKRRLLAELDCIGVSEMSLFPEPAHICNYLKIRNCLTTL
jgi:hypothetical protein